MISAFRALRNPARVLGLLVVTAFLAACQVGGGLGGGSGPRVSGQTVQVAMLLPMSSTQGGDAIVSRGLENAARLAAAELSGVTVEISVYDTAGQAATAANVAREAVRDGADVILGPLRSDAAAAVGVAVAGSNVSVLSFSNNTEVAGGNVFVLGHTFANTATRMVSYAAQRGSGNIVLVHASNLAGEVARDSVRSAAARSGANIAATIPYEFSQTGVINVVPQVVAAVREYGSNGLILTSDSAGALPFFAQLLPENGLDTEAVQVMGLTRWDIPPQTLEFAGLQGGWFALPDPSATADFEARYQGRYGEAPHNLAALGYDAVRAAGETAASAGRLGAADLTAGEFQGANGVFRLLADGTISRAMAIAQITDNQVAIIDPAPRRLSAPGF